MDWDKLRAFQAAVEAGSFTNAGVALNLSQSAINRQITALEQYRKMALFHRHAHGLKLTEQGEVLHNAVYSDSIDSPVGAVKAQLTRHFLSPCSAALHPEPVVLSSDRKDPSTTDVNYTLL
jgi:hypothetical protein